MKRMRVQALLYISCLLSSSSFFTAIEGKGFLTCYGQSCVVATLLLSTMWSGRSVDAPGRPWAKIIGGSKEDRLYGGVTGDGKRFTYAGSTKNYGQGESDCLFIQHNITGDVEWVTTFGGESYEHVYDIIEKDDGFVATGYTIVKDRPGSAEILLVGLNRTGSATWSTLLGGSGWELGRALTPTADGGFAMTGYTSTGSIYRHDLFLAKYWANNSLAWVQRLRITGSAVGYDLIQTEDMGYLVVGKVDLLVNSSTETHMLVAKFNATGGQVFTKAIGGERSDVATQVVWKGDNAFLVVGMTKNYGVKAYEALVLQLDIIEQVMAENITIPDANLSSNGTSDTVPWANTTMDIVWAETIGGKLHDTGRVLVLTPDGGFLVSGQSETYSNELFVAKYGAGLNLQWARSIGSNAETVSIALFVTDEDDYIVGGTVNNVEKSMLFTRVVANGSTCGVAIKPKTRDVVDRLTARDIQAVVEPAGLTARSITLTSQNISPRISDVCEDFRFEISGPPATPEETIIQRAARTFKEYWIPIVSVLGLFTISCLAYKYRVQLKAFYKDPKTQLKKMKAFFKRAREQLKERVNKLVERCKKRKKLNNSEEIELEEVQETQENKTGNKVHVFTSDRQAMTLLYMKR